MVRKNFVKTPFLSLIIPAYRQEKTILKDLVQIKDTMDMLHREYEVIVVVDGMVDNTFREAKKIINKNIKIVGYKHNYGKGFAVRYGMEIARGKVVAFLDAGMDIHPKEIEKFIKDFDNDSVDILIGSKLHIESKVNYPWQRRIMSVGYRILVKILFDLSVKDTQVGLKFFKKKVLKKVLPRLLVKKYAFDIEMLAVANYLGYKRIYERPVELNFNGSSSITSKSFWWIIFHMLWDTFAVFYRLKILKYYSEGNRRKWKYNPELNLRINLG